MKPVRGVVKNKKIKFGNGDGERIISIFVPDSWKIDVLDNKEVVLHPDDGIEKSMVRGSDCCFRGKFVFLNYYRRDGHYGRRLKYVESLGDKG